MINLIGCKKGENWLVIEKSKTLLTLDIIKSVFKSKTWDNSYPFFYLKKKINEHIVVLKKWITGRVFLFCRQCFSAS